METFSALLAICAGNSPVPGDFPTQRPVTRSFDVSFDLRLNKRLSKQSWGWWFETLSRPLWRQCNVQERWIHWGRVTHTCFGNLTIIGSDNGSSSGRRQAIIWINAGILLVGPLGTNFSEIVIEFQTFSFKKMHLKKSICEMAAILYRPQYVKSIIASTLTEAQMPCYMSIVTEFSVLRNVLRSISCRTVLQSMVCECDF